MRSGTDIRPITYMKTRAAELVRSVARTRRPAIITQHGEACAVVLDVASYEELREATLLLKLVAQGEADVRKGRTVNQDAVFARAGKRLKRTR